MIRAIILILSILNTNMTINVLIKWCYRKKVLRNHEVHLTMILSQERRNSISDALELRLSWTNPSEWKHFLHADFHVSLMIARTTFWSNTRVAGELRFHSLWFIHFSRPTCMWNSAEIFFPGFSPEFNRNIRRSRYKYYLTHWGRNNDGWCLTHIFNTFSWHEIN